MTDAADPELDKIKREQLLSDERKSLAEKRLAEEQKAAEVIAAQLKNARDRIGTITKYDGQSSSKADGTEAKAGVGLVDIRRRCAEMIGEIAEKFSGEIGDSPGSTFILYAGDEKPSTRNHLLFKLQHDAVNGMFDQAATDYQSAQGLEAPDQGVREAAFTLGTAVTAVSAILEIGAGIASYLKVNYTISGAEVTGFDDGFLAKAVAGKLTGKAVFMPGRWMPSDDQAVLDQVTELFKRNAVSAADLAHARERIAALNDELAQTADATRKSQISGILGAYDKAATALEAAQLSCEAFFQALRTADTQGIPWIALVAQESLVSEKIKDANLVFLQLHSVTGGCITSESLRDTFKAAKDKIPFRVAGGAVASYLVLDQDGKVLKSGQAQPHSGYKNLEFG